MLPLSAIMAELERRGFDLASLGGNCSKYSACSVDRNLMNASGKELERYEEEVALDPRGDADEVLLRTDGPAGRWCPRCS